ELSSNSAVRSVVVNLGFLVGSVAAGALLTVTYPGIVLAGLAGVFAASLIPLARITADERSERGPGVGSGRPVLEGFRVVLRDSALRVLVGITSVLSLVEGASDVLIVVAALGLLGLGSAGAGYLSASWGLGAMLGSAAALGLLTRRHLTIAMIAGSAGIGVSIALIGLVPAVATAVGALAAAGGAYAVVEITANTLLQRLAADDTLGRVLRVAETMNIRP